MIIYHTITVWPLSHIVWRVHLQYLMGCQHLYAWYTSLIKNTLWVQEYGNSIESLNSWNKYYPDFSAQQLHALTTHSMLVRFIHLQIKLHLDNDTCDSFCLYPYSASNSIQHTYKSTGISIHERFDKNYTHFEENDACWRNTNLPSAISSLK